jgi:hypothetical protein
VIQAAAKDSAFRRFTGEVALPDGERPVTVSAMALIFDSAALAARTFDRVAEAAHLRAKLDGCDVAVETVTSTGGLVSYWGYVHRDAALVVLTLDTLDPQHISVADLRSLTRVAADRLEAGLTP